MSWIIALRHYLVFIGLANLTWEGAQLPLHSVWTDASSATRYWTAAIPAIAAGFAFTALSEWLTTRVGGNWSYRELMPAFPRIAIGISPLAQWIAMPAAGFLWAPGTDLERET
jgi:hypothetical protein